MDKLLNSIDSINQWIGRIFGWIVMIIMLMVILEVIMRRLLNSPTTWNFEIVLQLYGFFFMIVAAYGLLTESHVAIDLVYQKLTKRGKAVCDIISYLLFFFPFISILLWQGTLYAATSWRMLETSSSALGAPLYLLKTVIPVSAALLLLQGLAIFIRRIRVLFSGGSDV